MSAMGLTSDENDWVFDYVVTLFRSPAWEVPIMDFIDEHCAVFDADEENKLIYTDLHAQFRELVEHVLGANLAELGLTPSDFAEICERSARGTELSMAVVTQILAMDDFAAFKTLMVKRNLELELEVMQALRDEASGHSSSDSEDMDARLLELTMLYKQEAIEQMELESAVAMSLAMEDEQNRLAKSAEDKAGPGSSMNMPRDATERAADLVQRSKEALGESKTKQDALASSAGFSDADLRRREQYLRQQRDRILEKKRKERESQLRGFRSEQKESPTEPPAPLAEKLQNGAASEAKSPAVDEQREALRVALARKMKQDLLQGGGATFDAEELLKLDEKMKRVEEMRRRTQAQERKVEAQLSR